MTPGKFEPGNQLQQTSTAETVVDNHPSQPVKRGKSKSSSVSLATTVDVVGNDNEEDNESAIPPEESGTSSRQKRKSKKITETDPTSVDPDDNTNPSKKVKRKYVWRNPRPDKKSGGEGSSKSQSQSEQPAVAPIPQAVIVDPSLDKLLSSVSCISAYWTARVKEVAKKAAMGGPTGSHGNHAQPLDVVRAVCLELERRGLPVYRSDSKLASVLLSMKGEAEIKAADGEAPSTAQPLTLYHLVQQGVFDSIAEVRSQPTATPSLPSVGRVASSVHSFHCG